MALDPVTLSVLQNGLMQVCNEMDLAFVRSAFSPVIAEALDRSDGIYHRSTGELIAQGELGLPVFVGTMQFSVQAVIERVQRLKIPLEEGDVFIVNDPYLGGTHLMDVKFVQPHFRAGRLWCWLANADQRIGDIKAQAAALATGKARLDALLDRYGDDTVDAAIAELKRRAARQMRERIATIADGTYEGEAFVDSDGVVDVPLRIAMRVTKSGGSDAERAALAFDMSGSSPPCQGPMNSVIATTKSSIYLAVKHVFPEVAINAGTFEPLHIVEPEGTFLYARYPRPVSGCAAEVSQRIAEAVFAALGKAIPEQLFGAPAGTSGNLGIGGFDPEKQRAYVMYVISGGGYGGSPEGDGISNGCSTIGISKTTPIEIMEQLYPVLFEEYSLHEGSGGAGEHRGGFGVNYRIRLRRGEARVSMVMDHGRSGPPGAQGGGAGGTNKVEVIRAGVAYVPPHLSKDQDIAIRAGDVVAVSTPGGGGFGPPMARPRQALERDVALGYYSADEARRRFARSTER